MKKLLIKCFSTVMIITILIFALTCNVFAVTLLYETYNYTWAEQNILEISAIEELGYLPNRNRLIGSSSVSYVSNNYSTLTIYLEMSIKYFNSSLEPEIMPVDRCFDVEEFGGEPEGISILSDEFYNTDTPWMVTLSITYTLDEGMGIYQAEITVFSDGTQIIDRIMIA